MLNGDIPFMPRPSNISVMVVWDLGESKSRGQFNLFFCGKRFVLCN